MKSDSIGSPTSHRQWRPLNFRRFGLKSCFDLRAAIVQKLSIQYTMNPPWPNLRFIGTPNARLMSVYHNEIKKYDASALTVLKSNADFKLSCAPIRSPLTCKIWKMENVKVRSCRLQMLDLGLEHCKKRQKVRRVTHKDQSHHCRPHCLRDVERK